MKIYGNSGSICKKLIAMMHFYHSENVTLATRDKLVTGILVMLLSVTLLTSSIFSGPIITMSSSPAIRSSPIVGIESAAAQEESSCPEGQRYDSIEQMCIPDEDSLSDQTRSQRPLSPDMSVLNGSIPDGTPLLKSRDITMTVKFNTIKIKDSNSTTSNDLAKIRLYFEINGRLITFPASDAPVDIRKGELFELPQSLNVTVNLIDSIYEMGETTAPPLYLAIIAVDENKVTRECIDMYNTAFRETFINELGFECKEHDLSHRPLPHVLEAYGRVDNFGQGDHIANSTDYYGESFEISYRVDLNGEMPSPPTQSVLRAETGDLIDGSGGMRDGCSGDPLGRMNPQWVPVNNVEQPQTAEGIVKESYVSHKDTPYNHESHDWIFKVAVPGDERHEKYQSLVSTENGKDDAGNPMIEMEWEIKYFPREFWPVADDRIWVVGRWVWDCSHFNEPEEDIRKYRTEIHPPLAYATTRFEPTIFRGDKFPSPTYVTRIYISGDGYIHGLGGPEQLFQEVPLLGGQRIRDFPTVGRNYEFDIDLPPKPPVEGATIRAEVQQVLHGDVVPELSIDEENHKVHVKYPLESVSAPDDQKFSAVVVTGWREPLSHGYRTMKVTFDSVKVNNDQDPWFSGEWNLWARASGKWIQLSYAGSGLNDVDDNDVIQFKDSYLYVTIPDSESSSIDIQTTGWESDFADDLLGSSGSGVENLGTAVPTVVTRPWKNLIYLGALLDDNDPIGIIREPYPGPNFGTNLAQPIAARSKPHPEDIKTVFDYFRSNFVTLVGSETTGDHELRYTIEEVERINPGQPVSANAIATVSFESVKVIDAWNYDEFNQNNLDGSKDSNNDNITNNANEATLADESPSSELTGNNIIGSGSAADSEEATLAPGVARERRCLLPDAELLDPSCRKIAKMLFDINVNNYHIRTPSTGTIDMPLDETFYWRNEGKPIAEQPGLAQRQTIVEEEQPGCNIKQNIPTCRVLLRDGEPLVIRVNATDILKEVPELLPPGAVVSCPPIEPPVDGEGQIRSSCDPKEITQDLSRTYQMNDNNWSQGIHHEEKSLDFYGEYFIITYRIEIKNQ